MIEARPAIAEIIALYIIGCRKVRGIFTPEVLEHLARPNRYVLRVLGDSMTPTLQAGDLVVLQCDDVDQVIADVFAYKEAFASED